MISILIVYVQMFPLKAHSDVSSRAKDLNFGLSLHLHSYLEISKQNKLWQVCADSPEPSLLSDVKNMVLSIRKFSQGFNFCETSHIFVKIKSSRNGEITLSFTDISKSCPNHNYLHRKYVF